MKKQSSSNKLKPALRFPQFTDSWELRKFSDLVLIERGGSPRPIESYITTDENGLNWVKIGDAPAMGNYITETAQKIKPEGLKKTREVHPGDLILSNSMSFGKPYIMAIDGCIHDGWLLIRDINQVFDLKFLCNLLGTDSMLNQYKSMAAGSTVNNLNKELVGGTTVNYPSIDEQIKIGEFFESLDIIIALHQRKLDAFKKYKRGLVQKIINKNLNNKSFEYSLSQILTEYNEKSSKNGKYEHVSLTKEGVVPKTDRYERDFLVTQNDKQYRITHFNDICYNPANLKFGVICRNKYKDAIFSPIYITFKVNAGFIPEYIELIVTDVSFIKKALKYQQGTVYERMSVSPEDLLKIKVFVPSEEEQRYIVSLFSIINEHISNENRYLEMTKAYKNGLLQQMFI